METINNIDSGCPYTLSDYLFAMQQYNLVYNSDFRYFSNQTSNATISGFGIPDGWIYANGNLSSDIGFDVNTNQCVIEKINPTRPMVFLQNLHEFPRWQEMLLGQYVTAKVCLDLSADTEVSIVFTDGIDTNTVTKNDSGAIEIEIQLRISKRAKQVTLSIESATIGATIGISRVYANVGKVALPNLPCIVQGVIGERKQYLATETAPAEELSLCQKSGELSENYTRLDTVLQYRYGKGANGRSLLPNIGGYFSRAWDNVAKVDPDADARVAWEESKITGNHVSTLQKDEFLEHDHGLDFAPNKTVKITGQTPTMIINATLTSETNKIGGNETRAINITELYTIKWA
ncbi:hypothetical protein [uncultured Croceitalea sp.]|uniref:hypothetical protein n=1 Tax=uncultured Croceitalea sp. TaxID=1798908 RepID=UPI0033056796